MNWKAKGDFGHAPTEGNRSGFSFENSGIQEFRTQDTEYKNT